MTPLTLGTVTVLALVPSGCVALLVRFDDRRRRSYVVRDHQAALREIAAKALADMFAACEEARP